MWRTVQRPIDTLQKQNTYEEIMTIGKSTKKSLKSPKHLDLSSGFYGRLEEMELEKGTEGEMEERRQGDGRMVGRDTQAMQTDGKRGSGVFDFNQGMLEDDGTATLLRKSPGRRSSRWRRKSGSRKKRVEAKPEDSPPAGGAGPPAEATENTVVVDSTPALHQEAGHLLVHFSVREEADDQVLISKQAERETKGQRGEEEIKVAKQGKLKNYRKALDRALRRGWETFVSNLYSVSLMPISSPEASPCSTSPTGLHQSSAIAEYR